MSAKTPAEIAADNKTKFHTALGKLHSDLEAIKKDEKNPFFNSSYVPLNKMIKTLRPVLKKHGFILSQPTDIANSQNGIVNVVFTRLEHSETGLGDVSKLAIDNNLIVGKNGKADMQGLGGAITYARRYTLSALLGLEEIDDDGNTAVGNKPKKGGVKAKDGF